MPRRAEPRATSGAPDTPEAWLAWVFDDLSDGKRRALWADWLLEQGDPRGELISLQLQNKEPKRVATLVKKHARVWLGKLSGVIDVKSAEFDRGVAVGGTVLPAAEGRVFPDDAAWKALERISVPAQRVGPKLEGALLGCVPRLTALDGATLPFLRKALAVPAPKLVALSFNLGVHAAGIPAADLALLATVQVPALRRLRVSGQPSDAVVRALTGLPWFGQLERLVVDGGLVSDRLVRVQQTSLPRLDVLAAQSPGWEPTQAGFSYRATRTPGAKWKLEAIAMPEAHRTVPPDYFYETGLLHDLTMLRGNVAEVTLVAPKGFQPTPKVAKKVAAQIARLVR